MRPEQLRPGGPVDEVRVVLGVCMWSGLPLVGIVEGPSPMTGVLRWSARSTDVLDGW
jgi:hypothetical protein